MTELALLYESYLAVCKTGRGDPVTRQMRLRDLLDETDFLDGRTVFLDGFSDFTALQQQILAAILAHAEAVHVSVLTSGGEPGCLPDRQRDEKAPAAAGCPAGRRSLCLPA